VRISIATGGERTLLPSGEFSRYTLHFETNDSVTPQSDVETKATNIVIPLDPADWTITVTASVYLNGEYVEAAEGTAQVILAAEEMKGVSIRISANTQPGAKDGYFGYAVSYPKDVASGSLEIYDSNGNPVGSGIDLLSEPTEDTAIALAPGYYLMRVSMETSYSMAVRTEIVHIYPGLKTRWDHAFIEADFGIPIAISGTVDLSGLGPVSQAAIALFPDSNFVGSPEMYFIADSPSGLWSWTVRTLPFNQPTNLYVGLWLEFPSGDALTRLMPVPVSVYNQNVATPKLGPFKASHFNLSGTVDFSNLTPLTITGASVHIYKDSVIPEEIGSATVNYSGDGAWSLEDLFSETATPVRIVLKANTTIGAVVYDEIQRTLTKNLSDLDFVPGMMSAGTTINGAAADSQYSYLFKPDVSGYHVFTASSDTGPISNLSVYKDAGSLGSASGADATLSLSLNAGDVYSIRLTLSSPCQTFQLRVDPAAQATLGGTVDFTSLISSFGPDSGVTVTSADIKIYADSNAHLSIGTGTVNLGGGSWTATVGFAGASTSTVLVITANLSNGQVVRHQEYLSISGDNNDLNFAPTVLTGQDPVFRTTVDDGGGYGGDNALLYVPARTGLYSFMASAVAGEYMQVTLYDESEPSPPGDYETVATLTEGKPYRVVVKSPYSKFATYQFQAKELPPVTLSGTVSFAGLAPLTIGNINYTEIQVYNTSNLAQLESPVRVKSDGSWTADMPPASADRSVRIAASVHLRNGGQIDSNITTVLPGSTAATSSTTGNLNFAPTSVTSGEPHNVTVYADSNGTWLLWIPTAGEYVLDVEQQDNMDPQMSLYDTSSSAGNPIAVDDDSGDGLNSRIHRNNFVAGRPYLVQVKEAHNGAGTFRFTATVVP
jgi:hypothetical protein